MVSSIFTIVSIFLLLGSVSANLGGTGGGGGKKGGGKKGSGSGKRARRSRNLISANSIAVEQDDPDYRAIARACGDYEYEGALYVDTHLYAIASPLQEAELAGCPFVVTHTSFEDAYTVAEKELLVFENKRVGQRFYGKDGTYVIGTFKLSEILRAFEDSDPAVAGVYDALTNTCASYMVDLALHLDVKIDTQVTSFIVRRLLEHNTRDILDRVRSHVDFSSLFDSRHLRAEDVTDEELVEIVVEMQASSVFV